MSDPIKVCEDLMLACDSLMREVTGKEATNWGLVNDAMVAGHGFVAEAKKAAKQEEGKKA